ncbi:MAG: type I-MYXAN CRISPR-associated Cas8a1/Cmx1 [Desulfurellaceae bacterium]|nr:type I-MYXAN CRISPR-associated Cas8a1/Cmx1 [Desulfurellaceae bacterium]
MESLTCDLFAPGMTPLHRAGLGGLVSTLRWIEKSLPDEERPPGRWTIDERSVTLSWEEAGAKPFFDRLFNCAFQIQEGLIYLPGQYGELSLPLEVRAALHEGLLLSFYDHGPTSRGSETAIESTYEIDDKPVSYRYLPLSWYKHQNTQGRGKGKDGSALIVDSLTEPIGLTSALFPGAIQRHAAHSASQVTQSAELVLPLLFAPVGTMALKAGGKKVNDRGTRRFKPGAALLIPDLNTLLEVEYFLPTIIPRNARDCQISNVADAALQAELRLRSRNLLDLETLSALRCVWCCPNDWNSRLQPPSAVTEVSVDATDIALDQFEIAMAVLAPPSPRQTKKGEYFWPKSYARPFIAENLALGRPWSRPAISLSLSLTLPPFYLIRQVFETASTYNDRRNSLGPPRRRSNRPGCT